MKLIAGSSNLALARQISAHLDVPLVETELSQFGNGEKKVRILEHLTGEDVVIIQSFSKPVDEHIMEFLLLADAVERMGARDVHVIIPWLGYSLQDKVFRPGEPIAAKVIANLVSHAYVKRVYLLDLHNSSTPGFFSVPSVHLSAMELFAEEVKTRFAGKDIVIASPDFGGLKRARSFSELLDVPLVNIDKHRDLHTGQVSAHGLHGDVADKVVILFDDVIVSGSTVRETCELLKREGAAEAHFFATHGIFTKGVSGMVAESAVDSVTITNTIMQNEKSEKLKILDCSPLFAEALEYWV